MTKKVGRALASYKMIAWHKMSHDKAHQNSITDSNFTLIPVQYVLQNASVIWVRIISCTDK